MGDKEVRWHQRLSNYNKALVQLNNASELSKQRTLSELERQGLIQSFEFTHELAWKVMKDFFFHQGNSEIFGSRDATRAAFKAGLIGNGEEWMSMITSRNKTSHTYSEDTAESIIKSVLEDYIRLLNTFGEKMNRLKEEEENSEI